MLPANRQDDLDALRQRKLSVPAVFRRGAWLTVALGAPSVALGPSASQLLLWLPVATAPGEPPSWAEVDAAIGARGVASSRTVPADAVALWAGGPGPELTTEGAACTVYGAEYPAAAFGNIFWKLGWALGTRAGLLVSLVKA